MRQFMAQDDGEAVRVTLHDLIEQPLKDGQDRNDLAFAGPGRFGTGVDPVIVHDLTGWRPRAIAGRALCCGEKTLRYFRHKITVCRGDLGVYRAGRRTKQKPYRETSCQTTCAHSSCLP